MARLLWADFYHFFKKKWFWLTSLFMVGSSIFFCIMQYTAMDYVVGLDRVIFLPMAFYGIAAAALITMVVGEDFSDGIIRNKIVSGKSRISIYGSLLLVSCTACIAVYAVSIITSFGIGVHFFENNVDGKELLFFCGMGIGISIVYACLFCTITTLSGNKAFSAVLCMILSFVLLFLAVYFNGLLAQPEYKNSVLNLRYVAGMKRSIYGWLYDINPFGQAAQLSQMKCSNPLRCILVDIVITVFTGFGGRLSFSKKDIK